MEELQKLKIPPSYDLGTETLSEFSRLKDVTYLDHAASTLYSETQVRECMQLLTSSLYGNPHSRNSSSDASTQGIEHVRQRILEFFNTTSEDYAVIFTSGATDALRLIAHNFPWKTKDRNNRSGAFVHTQENHTSVLGIRANASKNNAEVVSVTANDIQETLKMCPSDNNSGQAPVHSEDGCNILFAYPAQCNYSGSKYPLQWINQVQNGQLSSVLQTHQKGSNYAEITKNWFVLLDAASFVATSPLDLSQWKPDFVPVSFYKIFGYPTGIGCLLVSKRAWSVLDKTYYGGGTVQMIQARHDKVVHRVNTSDRYEDGTLPFLNILALNIGFHTLKRITGNMNNVQEHVYNLAYYVYYFLRSIKHHNGVKVAQVHCQQEEWSSDNHGSIVNFSLFNSDGSHVGYSYVEEMASIYSIDLRTGCVCNPGSCQKYLNISPNDLEYQYKMGHTCGDAHDLVDGHPTGSVRISFGYMTTYEDVDKFINMITDAFVDGEFIFDTTWALGLRDHNDVKKSKSKIIEALAETESKYEDVNSYQIKSVNCTNDINQYTSTPTNCTKTELMETSKEVDKEDLKYNKESFSCGLTLTDIIVYPVKSCSGMRVDTWEIGDEGLLYDRKWMIVDNKGTTITQKRLTRMCLIKPFIDLTNQTLCLSYPGHSSTSISLNRRGTIINSNICNGRVCGDQIKGEDCGDEVSLWLSQVLDHPGLRLLKQVSQRTCKINQFNNNLMENTENISLVNESQFVIVQRASVRELLSLMPIQQNHSEDKLLDRFRGNLIIEGKDAYAEDNWTNISINDHMFKIQSRCRRCQMIGVVPDVGERTKEPMKTLALTRGSNMYFGVHASCIKKNSTVNITVGSHVNIIENSQ